MKVKGGPADLRQVYKKDQSAGFKPWFQILNAEIIMQVTSGNTLILVYGLDVPGISNNALVKPIVENIGTISQSRPATVSGI